MNRLSALGEGFKNKQNTHSATKTTDPLGTSGQVPKPDILNDQIRNLVMNTVSPFSTPNQTLALRNVRPGACVSSLFAFEGPRPYISKNQYMIEVGNGGILSINKRYGWAL
jgi:hypothetical protein